MLSITADLLHGTIRAASPDALAFTGELDPGDWPPSPARLFAALVAADGTRGRCRVTDGTELGILEEAAPPTIYASPRSQVLVTELQSRFVVAPPRSHGAAQEYVAREPTLVRPGTRLAPRDRRVVYVWNTIDADHVALDALRRRAARVGYLGCSDSPVRLTVDDRAPSVLPDGVWTPEGSGDVAIPVPFPGSLATLDAMFDAFTDGAVVSRAQYRTELAGYRSPDSPPNVSPVQPWATTIWLRFEESLPGTWCRIVGERLKAATLELYSSISGAAPDEVPAMLHGHTHAGTRGYQLAQWVALPDVGYGHSAGRLHGAAVMLPADTEESVVGVVEAALRRLHTLWIGRDRRVRIRFQAGETRPWAAHPDRWQQASRQWVSATPVVQERRSRGVTVAEATEWCAHAGFPPPTEAWASDAPLLSGASWLKPSQVFGQRREARRPYSHLSLRFPEPVRGPMVLGRARQYGIGLMAPIVGEA